MNFFLLTLILLCEHKKGLINGRFDEVKMVVFFKASLNSRFVSLVNIFMTPSKFKKS